MSNTKARRRRLQELFVEQNGICWICDLPMEPPQSRAGNYHTFEATLDHLTPKGANIERPVKAAHAKCNHVRHHASVTSQKMIEHIAWIKFHPYFKDKMGPFDPTKFSY